MGNGLSSEFFAANRQRLRELFTGTAPIVVSAAGLLQRGSDSAFKFVQDASFYYLTGIDEPDITLVMDRDKEFLIVPGRSHSREAFDGQVDGDELIRQSGIDAVYDEAAGWDKLSGRLKKVKHVATVAPPPAYIEGLGLYTNPARASLVQKLKQYNGELKLLDLAPHLMRLRTVKQPTEVQAIQAAIDATIGGFKDTLKPVKLHKYGYEYEIEAELTRGFRRRGAAGHAFDPIVASGPRGCTLHYLANDHALAADELVVMDVGAEVDHYAADITRTVALGTPNRRQQAIHAAVCEAQDYALGLLKPGVILKDYEDQVEQFIGEKLRELNLIKSISSESVRQYYPHRVSHYMGLNVHDAGDYDRPLEAGVVMTVEPGIYVPQEAIGVRIEDDVLITDSGVQVLSNKLPRDLS